MVMNSALVGRVAHASAHACQYIACNPERFSSERVLYLLFCFPCLSLPSFFCCFPDLSDHEDSHSD